MFFPDAVEAGTDNRNIVDDGKSQKLTRDDIEALKEKGLKGQVHMKPTNFDTCMITTVQAEYTQRNAAKAGDKQWKHFL